MGFKSGNILEPSCGIGNFFGMLPESMKQSKLYGIELDSITGRIAKQLYQNADIAVQGFEQTNLPDSFFDLAIGNVPFGDYGVADTRYDKNKFSIHEYFFAKTLDKVRPGGIVALVVSRFTMDKKNSAVRKYLAERAELLGAVRLPNNAFQKNAGTGVTADILFLQKRDRPQAVEPDWIHTEKMDEGYSLNSYFVDHPEMILGTLSTESTQYGKQDVKCSPIPGADLGEQLKEAMAHIEGYVTNYDVEFLEQDETESIPADPTVRNYSYTLYDGNIYYRENSRMNKVDVSLTAENRIRGMIGLRDCMRRLIDLQMENADDYEVHYEQEKLSRLYDNYSRKYGLLNSRGNSMAFSDDSAYFLICSLEILDEEGKLKRKADMFTKRTIHPQEVITSADTASEALAISLGEKAKIDIAYMAQLTGKDEQELVRELRGVVFRDFGNINPEQLSWESFKLNSIPLVTADEYLSGNVRAKLKQVQSIYDVLKSHSTDADLLNVAETQVETLKQVQPKDLGVSEIDVRLGATWIPTEYIEQFTHELLKPSNYLKEKIRVRYSPSTATWNISNKGWDNRNVAVTNTYGTKRMIAYKIIEDTLNLKDVRVWDKKTDVNGNEIRVLNPQETMIAQQKQQTIKDEFEKWIWQDMERRDTLCGIYNERFNAIRPREYDGSHLRLRGINPEIVLREHQKNAAARVIYGGNTLLAHVVGAGKTFEMTAAAMELKRLGLCQKSLFVVPNHLTEQWAVEFLQLYPAANILVATKRDFETANRKKFCARIASGDYDAVIIGHSQFEKIPLSAQRQAMMIEEQIDEIVNGIAELKQANAERFTIKQMEKSKKRLEAKLTRLTATERKDDVVTFEELGVDRLFVDEAHFYKNLFLYTKMRNVAGLAQTESQKSADLFGKTRYLDELTDGRGTVFATGTPISNSMTEMYTMQRYLQYDILQKNMLTHFDCWASTFGETVTAIELKPEGTGYRPRTRFARFFNLPELISMFKECADIRTADTLDLPVPKAEFHTIVTKPSDFQKEMVAEFAERAEAVRKGDIDPTVDNMLKITNDGRKLALDQRLINSMLGDEPESKVNACVDNIFSVYERTEATKGTQLVFSDLSTPHSPAQFSKNADGVYVADNAFSNAYEDVLVKLINKGIAREEIAFIHDASTDMQKAELFSKVRSGIVRVMLGSTSKMGAGTNVQDKLAAIHHLDVPWRPSDIEQREGRGIRQGNTNETIEIFRYVTENTFDSYMWQTIENKQKFISQIMTSKSPVRSCEDVDEAALSYAEIKMLATGNPYIKEKMDLDIEVARLRLLQGNYLNQKYELEDKVAKHYPIMIEHTREVITGLKEDIERLQQNQSEEFPGMMIEGVLLKEKAAAGAAILELCKSSKDSAEKEIGSYKGFAMLLSFDTFNRRFNLTLKGVTSNVVELGADVHGNITRIENVLDGLSQRLEVQAEKLNELVRQIDAAKAEIGRPFEQEAELMEKSERLAAVTALLNLDDRTPDVIDTVPEDSAGQEKTQETAR
ncbi:MAG: DEAD/DEAH box helicase family protein [Christensenella sp.]